ncbi:hypothetical protein C9374_003926 [Naegleria lovaniensis]|uniref:Proteasome activator complex subunit 4 n=1 Tax=Naegleria lovaniensis TaxID=51637 RepID=A0AA88KSH0_NAELO|nr:uncharacterized protein C9374_003926 [Naegleria lovaniensis]KAG2394162.1 hypothetical protein C9374_003926 [Naegleria lovaniensis]
MKRTFEDFDDDDVPLDEDAVSSSEMATPLDELPPALDLKIEGKVPTLHKKAKTEQMLYKYHKFLPKELVKVIPEESEEWRKELMQHFRQYTPDDLIVENIRWEHFDYSLMLLKRYTEIKYPLLLSEKAELCKILFNILKISSKDSYSVDFSTQVKCCYGLSSLLKKSELLDVTFDWKVVYDIIDKTYFTKFRNALYSPREHGAALVDLIRKLKRYFTEDSTYEMLKFFRPMLCINDHKIFQAQAFLSIMLPTKLEGPTSKDPLTFKKNHYDQWVDEFFGIWDWIGLYPTWDLSFFTLFANLAQDQAGYVDWEPYTLFIFTKTMKCFDLPIGNTPVASNYEEYPNDELNLLTPFDIAKNLLLANAAKLIVWMISKKSNALKLLNQLIKSVSNFFQPSNEGQWTSKCADFLLILCTKFGKRLDIERGMKGFTEETYSASKNGGYQWIPEEYRLTEDDCKEFVSIVQPLAMTSLFSKSNQMTTCANHSLKHLAYILPQEVFPSLMERSFYALETLTNTHQTISALETLSLVVFPLLKYSLYPDGANYLSNLLQLTLPGIDVNDNAKTFSTLKFYTSLLVCVPLCTTGASQGDRTPPEVVRVFEDWSIELLERIFNVLSHQTDPKTAQGDTDVISPSMFWGLCDLLFNQMSTELLDISLKRIYNFVDSNFLFNAKKNIAHMCSSIAYAYPEQTLALFIPMLYKKLVDRDGKRLKNLTDMETQYYLQILGQVCYRTGAHLLKYRQQIETVISLCYISEKKKVVKICGKLFRNVLRSLTKYYLLELKSVNASQWSTEEFKNYHHWQSWGEFISLDEFEINWHEPTQEELQFAIELCNRYLTDSVANINACVALMKEKGGNIPDIQKLKNHLIFIRYAMRGGNTLYPEIEKGVMEEMNQYPSSRLIDAGLCVAAKCKSVTLASSYEQVCDTLHDLTEVILEHRSDKDPNLIGKICKIFFPMIAMRGGNTRYRYKKKKSSHEFVKQHSYKDVYSTTSNKYPRYLLLIQALLEYKVRCVIHNESIPYTKYHQRLLDDLLRLSLHSYSEVRKRAQSVLMSCINKFSDKVIKSFLPRLIEVLVDKKSTDEQRTGCIFILEKPFAVSCVIRDWDLCSKFLLALFQTSHIEKQSIQQRLAQLFETYFNAFYHIQIANEKDRQKYERIILETTEIAKSKGGWHWKYHTFASSFLMLMIRPDQLFPVEAAKFFFKQMISDLEKSRIIACEAINLILCQYKPVQKKKLISPHPTTVNNTLDWGALGIDFESEENWKKSNCYEKNYFGWYTLPDRVEVYDYEQPKDCSKQAIIKRELQPILLEDDFVSKFIRLLTHRDDGFIESNAQLFKGLFQVFPCESGSQGFLDLCKPHIESILLPMVGSGGPEEVHHVALISEIVGGLIRGMKHWDYSQQQRAITEFIIPVFDKVLEQSSTNSVGEISEGLEFAICDKDIRRLGWLIRYMIEKTKSSLQKKDVEAILQARFLKYLYGIVGEISWRSPYLLRLLLDELCSTTLHHDAELVREYVGLFVSFIYKSLWNPPRLEHNKLPSFTLLNITNDETQYDYLRKFNINLYEHLEQQEKLIKTMPHDSPEFDKKYSEFKNLSKTVLAIISGLFNSSSPHCGSGEITNYIKIISTIYEHTTSQDDDLQSLCQHDIISLSAFSFSKLLANTVITFLYDEIVGKDSATFVNWSIRSALLEFLQIFAYRQEFYLTDKLPKLFEIITTMLRDQQLEVRQMAAITLSGFLKISSTEYSEKLIPEFKEKAFKNRNAKISSDKLSSKETTERHSGVLGLSAVALAFPYSVPDFIPDMLCSLAKFANDSVQSIRETVKKTFQEFVKCHSDMWQIHQQKFTEQQLGTLHDLFQTSSPSYYA